MRRPVDPRNGRTRYERATRSRHQALPPLAPKRPSQRRRRGELSLKARTLPSPEKGIDEVAGDSTSRQRRAGRSARCLGGAKAAA